MNKLLVATFLVLFIWVVFRTYESLDMTPVKEEIVVSDKSPVSPEFQVVTLDEASNPETSNHLFWWLNSGGRVYFDGKIIRTLQGDLPANDVWRLKYLASNPAETDDGYHPQNIFRLVTREKYQNQEQAVYFRINRYILSEDEHRAASNGVLFFQHYQDGDNLYYVGLRVDGKAVIKKKQRGKYFSLLFNPLYTGGVYDRISEPNLLPLNSWVGMKANIVNTNSSTVLIKLFVDLNNTGSWQLVAEAVDDGKKYGGKAITEPGFAGIRTDFMDAEFDDYQVTDLAP